jgi:hypothetical protein
MVKTLNNQPPIACNLDAMSETEKQRHSQLRAAMEANIAAVAEAPDGLTFRFDGDPQTLLLVAEFVTLERLCCPFLYFSLEVEPDGGPLWLRLKGGQGDQSLTGLIQIEDFN